MIKNLNTLRGVYTPGLSSDNKEESDLVLKIFDNIYNDEYKKFMQQLTNIDYSECFLTYAEEIETVAPGCFTQDEHFHADLFDSDLDQAYSVDKYEMEIWGVNCIKTIPYINVLGDRFYRKADVAKTLALKTTNNYLITIFGIQILSKGIFQKYYQYKNALMDLYIDLSNWFGCDDMVSVEDFNYIFPNFKYADYKNYILINATYMSENGKLNQNYPKTFRTTNGIFFKTMDLATFLFDNSSDRILYQH